jgi:hypothetical protein
VKLPFTQKIYIRPNWREVQRRPGKLDFPDWWQITFDLAKRYNKRVGFRIMLENPDFHWRGLKLKAELEVKGVRYPVNWACHQKTNPDGSLTLQRNLRS